MVPLGDGPPRIMGAQRDVDDVERVGPVRMMVLCLCQYGHLVHEVPRFSEVLEFESPMKPTGALLPAGRHDKGA